MPPVPRAIKYRQRKNIMYRTIVAFGGIDPIQPECLKAGTETERVSVPFLALNIIDIVSQLKIHAEIQKS